MILESFVPSTYRKLKNNPVGKSFLFLLLFILIISTILSVNYTVKIKRAIPTLQELIITSLRTTSAKLPVIEIENGKLDLPKEPYFIPLATKFYFLVEPTRSKERIYSLLNKYDSIIVLTKDNIIVKREKDKGSSEIKIYTLKEIKYVKLIPTSGGIKIIGSSGKKWYITEQKVKDFFSKVSSLSFFILLIVFFSIYIITKPLQTLFFSLFALIFNAIFQTSLPYTKLLNISIYAIMPPTFLAIFIALIELKIPFFWVLYTIVYLTYLALGIKSTKEEGKCPESV